MLPDFRGLHAIWFAFSGLLGLILFVRPRPRLALFAGPTVHVSATDDPCCQGEVSAFSGGERLWQVERFAVRLGPGFAAGLRAF